jgi:hypothetical protein
MAASHFLPDQRYGPSLFTCKSLPWVKKAQAVRLTCRPCVGFRCRVEQHSPLTGGAHSVSAGIPSLISCFCPTQNLKSSSLIALSQSPCAIHQYSSNSTLDVTVTPVFPGLQAGTALANLVKNPLALQDFISGCVVAAAVHSKDLEVTAQALAALSALKLAKIPSQAHHELLWHSVAVMVSCTTEHRLGRIISSPTII